MYEIKKHIALLYVFSCMQHFASQIMFLWYIETFVMNLFCVRCNFIWCETYACEIQHTKYCR